MKICVFAALPLTLAACSASAPLPDVIAFIAATNTAVVTTPRPHDVLYGFQPRPVTLPEDWRELNDLQAPDGGFDQ
jgi:hypothetical protein